MPLANSFGGSEEVALLILARELIFQTPSADKRGPKRSFGGGKLHEPALKPESRCVNETSFALLISACSTGPKSFNLLLTL
jgi:hypothetical protein